MSESKEVLMIQDLQVTYVARWVTTHEDGLRYEYFELGRHTMECKYMPRDLHKAIEEFVRNVEIAHDRKGETSKEKEVSDER